MAMCCQWITNLPPQSSSPPIANTPCRCMTRGISTMQIVGSSPPCPRASSKRLTAGGVGQRRVLISRGLRPGFGASQPLAAIDAGRQTGAVRSGAGHLSGPWLRPLEHHLRRRRHRHDRYRSLVSTEVAAAALDLYRTHRGGDRPSSRSYTPTATSTISRSAGVTSQADVDSGAVACWRPKDSSSMRCRRTSTPVRQ